MIVKFGTCLGFTEQSIDAVSDRYLVFNANAATASEDFGFTNRTTNPTRWSLFEANVVRVICALVTY